MRLHSLALTNFRQHADTRVEFGSGITGIIGPNGSGKTTMLEAVAWALYGNEAARGRRDSIRFLRADPRADVSVELDFELAGHRYRVVRKLTSAELYLDGGEAPVANTITSVAQMLQRRLGMSRAEFFNTYFTGQKELALMATLGPAERAQFLSRVLGYERLRAAQEFIRERRRGLASELTGLQQGMPDRESVTRALNETATRLKSAERERDKAAVARKQAEATLAELTPKWENAQAERAARQQAMADLRVAEQALATLERDRDRVAAEVTSAADAVAELATIEPALEPYDALLAERDQLAILAREEGRRQTITETIRTTEEELAQRVARREVLVDAPTREEVETVALEAARRTLQEVEAAYDAARADWVSDLEKAKTKRQALADQYRDTREQRDRIVDAGEDGICPTCQRPLGANFRSVLEVLDAQLEAVTLDGKYFSGRVEQLSKPAASVAELDEKRAKARRDVDASQRRLTTVQAEVGTLRDLERDIAAQEQKLARLRADLATLPSGYDQRRHDDVLREVERLEPLHIRAGILRGTAQRGAAARAELDATTTAIEAACARVASLREAVGDPDADERAFEELRAAHTAASAAFHESERVFERAAGEVRAASEAAAHARSAADELARREARVTEVARDRRMHDELDRTFTDLRTDLNAVLRPELSKIASGFLAQLTDGRYTELDLDDQYRIVVVEDGAPKPVISGGEEDVANLVMRLAISQMIAERAGQAFSLLILDEVFGALDENRRQHVVELLRGLQSRFEQVVLITHIEGIRDGCDRVMTVRYDTGSGASVVEAAPVVAEVDLVGVDA